MVSMQTTMNTRENRKACDQAMVLYVSKMIYEYSYVPETEVNAVLKTQSVDDVPFWVLNVPNTMSPRRVQIID